MKVDLYEAITRAKLSRRNMLRGTAALGAMAVMPKVMGVGPAMAQDSVRSQILAIPGVGMGSPTDADWQKVGELCLGATKANVAQGEFAGVELSFMGLNNQNLHNLLFRGFLKPWEAYTGAKINWQKFDGGADVIAALQAAGAQAVVEPLDVDHRGGGGARQRLDTRTARSGRVDRSARPACPRIAALVDRSRATPGVA